MHEILFFEFPFARIRELTVINLEQSLRFVYVSDIYVACN